MMLAARVRAPVAKNTARARTVKVQAVSAQQKVRAA